MLSLWLTSEVLVDIHEGESEASAFFFPLARAADDLPLASFAPDGGFYLPLSSLSSLKLLRPFFADADAGEPAAFFVGDGETMELLFSRADLPGDLILSLNL